MERVQYDINDLVQEIPNSKNGIGEYLLLEGVYDNIKNARLEDDQRLSQGVWQTDLKKADWALVESLSTNVIINKSKDLQIIGWLIEATIHLDNLAGIAKSLNILTLFIESFWYTSFPLNDDLSSDTEQKIKLLNWIIDTINKLIININFLESEEYKINLYDYNYAINIHNILIRAPETESELVRSVQKDKKMTIDEVNKALKTFKSTSIEKTFNSLLKIEDQLNILQKTINKISDETPIVSFSTLRGNIENIKRILPSRIKASPQENLKNNQIEKTQEFSRDEIYNEINKIAKQLKMIEKHSPSYSMLELIFSWKNKTLLEIIDDLKNGDSEAHKLIKFLLSS